jgi:hypothetical protein
MSYDIIIGTDWMEKHYPHIDFIQCTISVGTNVCKMENVREDLIRECSTISTRELEALLTDDKIMEIMAWNISKVEGRDSTEEERDAQMDTLLKEFADVFSEELRSLQTEVNTTFEFRQSRTPSHRSRNMSALAKGKPRR